MQNNTDSKEPLDKRGYQILKTRDDRKPVCFTRVEDADGQFRLAAGQQSEWATDTFGPEVLQTRIEPWLSALVQSDHLSLLIGSGMTHAVHQMATEKPLQGMDSVTFDVFHREIAAEAKRVAELSGRKEGNFEDQLRVASELLRGMEILVSTTDPNEDQRHEKVKALRENLATVLDSFANDILKAERELIETCWSRYVQSLNHVISFLLSFASRPVNLDRLHLFTTNYDRYIENAAEEAGLRLIDRFVGSLSPVFRASRLDVDLHYNPPGIRDEPRYLEGVAGFTKLHGSIDWVSSGRQIRKVSLPFGANEYAPFLRTPELDDSDATNLMLYPNASKDRETAEYPYVELFRDLAVAICRPNSTVVCYGYGFGDEHINRVLEDMLTLPSTHLVIIAYGDPLGRIMDLYAKTGRHSQITLLVGDHLGDLPSILQYLPTPPVDRMLDQMTSLQKNRGNSSNNDIYENKQHQNPFE